MDTKKKFVCDLAVFRSLESTANVFRRGDAYCAQGKLAKACGIDVPSADENPFSITSMLLQPTLKFLREIGRKSVDEGGNGFKWNEVARLNNNRQFVQADRMVLELAYASGKVEFINGLEEGWIEPKQSCEDSSKSLVHSS